VKHIVFLIGEYKPFISPNGNIADSLIQEFKDKYKITIITRQNDLRLEKKCIIDGINVLRIRDYNLSLHKHFTEKILNSNSIFTRVLYKFLLHAKRMFFYIPRLFRRQSVSKYYINKIQCILKQVNSQQKIDILIPVSAPHEEVFAGVEYKKNHDSKCKLLIYQLDRFANANSLYEIKMGKMQKLNNNIQLELDALDICNRLFILPPLQQYYKSKKFEMLQKKIVVTEHPLVRKIKDLQISEIRNENSIEVLYGGSLDLNLRNPTYLFKLLNTDMMRNSNIKLSLYSFGNCQSIINKYKRILKETIFDHGRVSSKEIGVAMKNCNILLTIGNNSDNEVPSKLFEYLSYCKPIIHLYYSEKDAYLEYLKSYEFSLCIKMDEDSIEENSRLFYEFCNKYQYSNISFDTINDVFKACTPGFVAKQFIDVIEDNMEN
jgi:hypothetical protein